MRYIAFACLLCIQPLLCDATVNLDSFYKAGSNWTEYKYASYGQGTGGYYGYRYMVQQDSSIDSMNYHLLYVANIGQCTLPWWSNPPVSCNHGPNDNQYSLLGGIRVAGRQVFFLNLQAAAYNTYQPGQELVAYNFDSTLVAGDMIPWKSNVQTIQSIDSVQVNNVWLKRYNFEHYNNLYEDYWIEGIGSRLGLLGSYMSDQPTPQSYHALCYGNGPMQYHFVDSVLPGNLDANCFDVDQFVKVKELQQAAKDTELYPNPLSGDVLYLRGYTNEIEQVEILDITGRCLQRGQLKAGNRLDLVLRPGIYYLRLLFKDHSVSIKRLSKTA